jgi:hypothetical protein
MGLGLFSAAACRAVLARILEALAGIDSHHLRSESASDGRWPVRQVHQDTEGRNLEDYGGSAGAGASGGLTCQNVTANPQFVADEPGLV